MGSEDESRTAYIIIGVLIIIVIIFSVLALIYYTKKNEKEKAKQEGEIPAELYSFEIIITSEGKKISGIPYQLENQGEIVQEGIYEVGYKTEYKKVLNKTGYTLSVKTDEYYFQPVICSINVSACSLDLEKISVPKIDYLKYNGFYKILMQTTEGTIKDPAVCLEENTDRIIGLAAKKEGAAELDLLQVAVPFRLQSRYTRCFTLDSKEILIEKALNKIKEQYENIEDYNKAEKTKYKDFNEVPISQADLMSQEFSTISPGFIYLDIYTKLNPEYQYRKGDRLKVLLIDLYHDTEDEDIKRNDAEVMISLNP